MSAAKAGPLAGLRVLELGSTIAGPFCGRLLADFGADVIKIEAFEGDPLRTMGKRFEGKSLYAASLLRNKALICVDLRTPDGQEIARDLVRKSDIVIENFRPGRLEEWGLGYAQLSEINPGIIMVRISGFGQDGPYSQRAGYGVIGEAMSGLRHLTGDPQSPPSRVAVSMTDYITGLYAAFGATMAVLARQQTGRGQFIDAALYESAFSFMEPWIPAFEKLGHIPTRTGSRLPESTPNNLYSSAEGEFIHITAMGNAVFARLCEAMEQPELARDPRFAAATDRGAHVDAIDDIIGQWTSSHSLEEVERKLERAGVPASRIFTIADIFKDPHYKARQSIIHVPDDSLGTVAMATVIPRLSATPGEVRHTGHRIAQDTREVLSEILGFSAGRLDDLEARGVIQSESSPRNGGVAQQHPRQQQQQ